MKLVVAAFVLVGVIVMVSSEICHGPNDCIHVACPESNYEQDCVQGQCTCTHAHFQCSITQPCHDPTCDHGVHCVDGKCRCGFFPGPGGPGGLGPVGK
ncbi:hypothetical protein ACF0H5_008573 [Mactra antiquata]